MQRGVPLLRRDLRPQGLCGIERSIRTCEISLDPWTSGYNGKIILRTPFDSEMEWDMESSDDDIMFASESMAVTASDAEAKLRSLSECLRQAGFRHRILIDGPDGQLHIAIEHEWPLGRAP